MLQMIILFLLLIMSKTAKKLLNDKNKVVSKMFELQTESLKIRRNYNECKKELETYIKKMEECEDTLNKLVEENKKIDAAINELPEIFEQEIYKVINFDFGLPIDDIITAHHNRNKKRSLNKPYKTQIMTKMRLFDG